MAGDGGPEAGVADGEPEPPGEGVPGGLEGGQQPEDANDRIDGEPVSGSPGEESGELEVGPPTDVGDGTVVGVQGSVRGQQFGKTDGHGGTCAPQEEVEKCGFGLKRGG